MATYVRRASATRLMGESAGSTIPATTTTTYPSNRNVHVGIGPLAKAAILPTGPAAVLISACDITVARTTCVLPSGTPAVATGAASVVGSSTAAAAYHHPVVQSLSTQPHI